MLWLGLLVAMPIGASAAQSPLKPGEQLSGWTLDEVKSHPEYLRLSFIKADDSTQLEIVKGAGRNGLFCNPRHCVQPALGATPPKPLLEAVFSRLNDLETKPDAALPQQTISAQQFVPQDDGEENRDPYLGPALAFWMGLAASVLLLIVTLWIVRRRLSRKPSVALKRVKLVCMWALMLLPLVWLAIIAYVLVSESIMLADFDRDRELGQVKKLLTQKEGKGFSLERLDDGWQFEGAGQLVKISDDARPRVYVFGGSSVVVPVYNWAFPAGLQRLLDEAGQAAQVVNFGVPGYDSFDILLRAEMALKHAPPRLMIIYAGHNDFTNTYRSSFAAEYSVLTRHSSLLALALAAYAFTDGHAQNLPWEGEAPQFGSWVEYAADPMLIVAMERAGLLAPDAEAFRAMDRMIVEAYRKNLEQLAKLAAAKGTTLLLISPIGNLEAPVYSADAHGRDLYRQGIASSDYDERLELLKQARDLDTFSLDIRAKSSLYVALRQMETSAPGLRYFDLEATLAKSGFDFGLENFSDYVHFRQSTHERIAELLFEVIRNEQLLEVNP